MVIDCSVVAVVVPKFVFVCCMDLGRCFGSTPGEEYGYEDDWCYKLFGVHFCILYICA